MREQSSAAPRPPRRQYFVSRPTQKRSAEHRLERLQSERKEIGESHSASNKRRSTMSAIGAPLPLPPAPLLSSVVLWKKLMRSRDFVDVPAYPFVEPRTRKNPHPNLEPVRVLEGADAHERIGGAS